MSPCKSEVARHPRILVMNSPSESHNTEPTIQDGILVSIDGEVEAKHRFLLVQWLTTLLPSLELPTNITDDALRACLSDGTVLCDILNKLSPGSVNVVSESDPSLPSNSESVESFLKAMDGLGLPGFEISVLEKGSMKTVVDCLLALRAKSLQNVLVDNISMTNSNGASPPGNAPSNVLPYSPTSELKQRRVSSSPYMTESPTSLKHQVGHKFHEVFQVKRGGYADLPPAKISEMMKSVSLDNAPTQSLLSVVNGILEESVERRNGEIPHRVACLLRKVSQELERRITTQAEHLRTQNNLFKVREEKYQARLRVLEAIASGSREESEIIANQLPLLKLGSSTQAEKIKEEEKKVDDEDLIRLMKEQVDKNMVISALNQELETTKKILEVKCSQLEAEANNAKAELKQTTREYEHQLEELGKKVKEHEDSFDSQYHERNLKNNQLQNSLNLLFSSLQKLKVSWESIKLDVMKEQKVYAEECNRLGVNLTPLVHAAENYQAVIVENRKLFNEVQELKGNIRVYCRIKPFLSGTNEKQSIVEHIGEDDLVVANPSKHGKDALRSFKFNKIFSPASTQAGVYSDIQSFIRSVLDGYNVCIFAYGQTGSGKTYTMTGPIGATSENLGVNYRALNDLFRISTSRTNSIDYEIGVQMVEIYNEQVRDLLTTDNTPKQRLGIFTHSRPEGLAVPDACMFPVKSPSDVIKLMDIGLKNRATGATAMNERSSRSHSVVSIHVRGKDLNSGSTLLGNLHLVDLAGSERVDRSEVTGDRLREAQYINKSLSALGDVIFALSHKSSHVPYRNSKLTQLLQASLGGQAKTLMFVQINSDVTSFSETMSTLKFAERVSGVELGAARSSKESKDIKELTEQLSSLKNIILRKDEEIERLQLLRGSVGGALKHTQKPLIRSHKHLETDRQQHPMGDHIHQNEFLRQSEFARGDKARDIGAKAETSGSADSDCDERFHDRSDNSFAHSTDTDGSSEGPILTEGSKSSDKMEKSIIHKNIQAVRKLGRTSSATATSRDSPKVSPVSGIRRSTSGQLNGSKRWH